jgi:hypothetical protein
MLRRIVQLACCVVATGVCLAQYGSDGFRERFSRRTRGYSAPEVLYDRNGVPNWERDRVFPGDAFTFVRVLYNPYGGRRGKWATDWPDSDLNFSFRLQQLTALKVNPDPVIVELSDPRLYDFPFLYVIEPGGERGYPGTGLALQEEEVEALRRYCFNGGFVMVDDFWGEDEWDEFYREIKRVFPDREPQELDPNHEIFNCVYELEEPPQVPSIHTFLGGYRYERYDAAEVNYRGIFDDDGRLMVMICHNTDLGDGWEREGENHEYFKQYSEPKSYPMGINILFYAMTH